MTHPSRLITLHQRAPQSKHAQTRCCCMLVEPATPGHRTANLLRLSHSRIAQKKPRIICTAVEPSAPQSPHAVTRGLIPTTANPQAATAVSSHLPYSAPHNCKHTMAMQQLMRNNKSKTQEISIKTMISQTWAAFSQPKGGTLKRSPSRL